MVNINVDSFFDEESKTFSYVVADPNTKACAIIDSVLNYDAASACTSTSHADQIIQFIMQNNLTVEWILETHVHADHISAAYYLKSKLGGKIAMSHKIELIQDIFEKIYHLNTKSLAFNDGFDHLFTDDEKFKIGDLQASVLATPGHTPACISYVIEGQCVFIGDTLFMPDYGSARCDFPKGSAADLYDSVQKLYLLPDDCKVFLCHDYLPDDRTKYSNETTVLEQKKENIHLNINTLKSDFIAMRQKRDATLSVPKLMLPSIQLNMYAGQLPPAESNGIRYLKLPLNYFDE